MAQQASISNALAGERLAHEIIEQAKKEKK